MQIVEVEEKIEILKLMNQNYYQHTDPMLPAIPSSSLLCNNLEFHIELETTGDIITNLTFELLIDAWYNEQSSLYKVTNINVSSDTNEVYLAIRYILHSLKDILQILNDGRKVSDCIKSVSLTQINNSSYFSSSEISKVIGAIFNHYYYCFNEAS